MNQTGKRGMTGITQLSRGWEVGGVSWLLRRSVQCGGEFESGPLDVEISQFGNIS